ncbi:protein SPA1-RELATED 2 isoform X2 [Cryptomeria japonica]|uniref:protein SPA1-RELATED 2 isoform X2 n=1 Tax=Cryptomeria japonica TaxID=3369 RepID=UPI0025AC6007|nr:protein SPA1-RELATED 2 isoform X2 [Cryptomeria japonica]XP_057849275.1 protein SPA1-RELATED 2 isoform X2 [Cryptomeria japonica]
MEHAFGSRYSDSVQMPVKEDEGFTRKLTNDGGLSKFLVTSQQENHIPTSQVEYCYSSDAGGVISWPTNDLPEAISLLKSHTADNVNVAANLQTSVGKNLQTAEAKAKVKELCYTDTCFPHPFVSEPEFSAGITPLASLSSGDLLEVCTSEKYIKPSISHLNRQNEGLNARKNKESKIYYDEPSIDRVNQSHVRFRQNSLGPWNHLYHLAASAGSFRVHNENSMEKAGHSSQLSSFRGCNFNLQEDVENEQNDLDQCARMRQDSSGTPNQLKLKVGLPQNSSNSKHLPQNSHANAHVSSCNNSYSGPSLASKSVTQISEGIRTKILSSSCSYQFLVKDSLNDNRSAAARQVTVHSDISMSEARNWKSERELYGRHGEGNCQLSGTSSAHTSKLSLHGTMEMNNGSTQNGLILRQWLNQTSRKVNRLENLHFFKQIIELVVHAHSQGMVLRNIRPSCFMISSLNRIIYLESPCQSRFEFFKNQEYSSYSPVIHSPELHQNRKRSRQSLTTDFVDGQGHGGTFQIPNQKLNKSGTDSQQSGHPHVGADTSFRNQGSGSFVKSNSFDMFIGNAYESFSLDHTTGGIVDGNLLSTNVQSPRHKLSEGQQQLIEQTGRQYQSRLGAFDSKDFLLLEKNWYTTTEELNGGTQTFSSDIYALGVLLFELFCAFTSWEEQLRTMTELRHRILPPRFLSEYPREAGFCLWLLHPDPASRPKAKEIIQSEFLNEAQDALTERQAAVRVDEEDAESELLLDFLLSLQKQKEEKARKLAQAVTCLTSDIEEVNKRRSLACSVPVAKIQSDSAISCKNDIIGEMINKSHNCFYEDEEKLNSDNKLMYQQSFRGGTEDEGPYLEANPSRSHAMNSKGAKLIKNLKHLEQVYFSVRGKIEPAELDSTNSCLHGQSIPNKSSSINTLSRDATILKGGEYDCVDRLGCFFDTVCKYARYSRFEVRATLRHGDLLNTANVVCSVGFDRDQEFFATAGVSKKIKIFGCDAVLNENVDIHYPAVEMTSKSKLSSVCWNSYIKSHISSTDYDGVVQLWDASIGQSIAQYKEHQKRAWSVDFSHADPTKLASGSDDCSVKLWSINQLFAGNQYCYNQDSCKCLLCSIST